MGFAMKTHIYSIAGEVKGDIDLGGLFKHSVRTDLITRAFLAEQSKFRQPYGVDPLAGKRTSAHYHGRRGIRQSMMNKEMARMPRIHGQGYLNFTARFVPQAIKGRKAHPPLAEKIWKQKINKKEMRKALLSAISATAMKDMVLARGHAINGLNLPIVIEDKFEELKKAKEVADVFEKIGLKDEIKRVGKRKVRSGKGKLRSRRYREKKGPLIIVKEDKGIIAAAKNIPGCDAVTVKGLTINLLAPGSHPGRLCIWTKSAFEEAEKLA